MTPCITAIRNGGLDYMKSLFRKSKPLRVASALAAMFFAGGGSMTAQGYPVIDIAGLMNAIQQLYATYDQINSAIEQVQNTYQQLERQIKMVESMNWDDLASSFSEGNWSGEGGIKGVWENIGNFRTNMINATSAINSNLNLLNDVKHTLENKTVTAMGKQYSVAGLLGVGKYGQNNLMNLPASAWDYVKGTGKEIAEGFSGKLTYKEKQAIMNKYGLDPENYAYVKLVEEQAGSLVTKLFTTGSEEWYDAQLVKAAKTNEGLMELMQQAAESESTMKEMQATGAIILSLKGDILNLIHGVRETGAAWATESTRSKIAAEARMENEALNRERRRKSYMEATGYVPDWL